MNDKEKQATLKAIGDLGRRVTAADVATKTGLPLLTVQHKLNQVAMETNGHLGVGKSGDIVYSFSPGFTNAYLAKGVTAAMVVLGAKLMEVLFYVLRISFGVALVASLIIVVVLLIVIAIAMSRGMSGDDDDRGGGDLFGGFGSGGGFHFSFWDWMVLRDLFLWDSLTRQPVRYDYRKPTVRTRQRSNFLLNCFSFLFGDGDPNEGIAEKRWQVIAQVIKKHANVVTAEQLAPYTGADPKDENAVLPVLVRFNGRPEVTPSGHIAYVFESLQSTAADQSVSPPEFLQEFRWRFSNVPEGELLPVFVVAGLNLAGAWTVWNWIQRLPSLSHSPLMSLVVALICYGSLFVIFPVARMLINAIRNSQIEARNDKRRKYADLVSRPSPELLAKLKEAAPLKLGAKKIDADDLVFTTDKDSRDQADELSDQFDELEKKRGAKGRGKQQPSEGSEPSVGVDEDDDGVRIKIPKPQSEFDASP